MSQVKDSYGSKNDFLMQNLPLLKEDRVNGFLDNTNMNVALAIATWAFMIGGTLATFVGLKDAIIATVAGNVVGVLLTMIGTTLSSAKYGIEHWTVGRSWLGNNGMKIVIAVIIVTQIGWAVVLSVMCGRSVENIVGAATGYVSESGLFINVLAAIAATLGWIIAWKGPVAMQKLNRIVAPAMMLVMIGMIFLISKHPGGWGAIFALEPIAPIEGGRLVNFMVAFELNIGAGVSWWASTGGMARLCKTTRAAYWPNMFGICLAASIGTVIGVATSLAFNSIDPTEWMIPLGGLGVGVIALLFIAVANLSSTPVTIYNTCLGMRQYKIFENMNWGKLTALFMVPVWVIVCFFPMFIYDNFYILMGMISVFYVPLVAIQLSDYFFLRKRKIDLVAVYDKTSTGKYRYWHGFNWVAIFVFATACVIYVSLFDPIFLVTKPLFVYMTATGASFVYSVIAYTILGKIFLVNSKKHIGDYPQ